MSWRFVRGFVMTERVRGLVGGAFAEASKGLGVDGGLSGQRGRRGWRLVGVVVGVLASVLVVVPSGGVGAADEAGARSGLSAVSVEGGVLLGWDAPESGESAVSGYRVFRRLPERGERTLRVLVSDTGSLETSFLDASAAVEGELFVYRVVALFDGTPGRRSAPARVRYEAPDAEAEPVVRSVPEPEPEQEAEPDVVVLSGVLGVGSQGGVSPVMSGFSTWARLGSLSPRSFSMDGSAVRVLMLLEHPGGLFLTTDRAIGADFVLDVGAQQFVGSDSLVPALPVSGAYWWPSASALWSDGDTVDVELRVAADAVPIGVRDAAPVWAFFDRFPEAHDGTGEFSVRLRFAEDVDTDATALSDSALAVSGGSVTSVEPAAAGSTRNWTVTVVPDGAGDVTVGLAGALGCADPAAVCTTDGRTLPAGIEVSVAGPAASVSLSSLTLVGALLDPAFDPEVTLYTAQADVGVSQVTVAAVARDAAASVDILPADADPDTAGHQIAVTEGAQTAAAVTVTAADGHSLRRYWIVLDGPPESGGSDVQEVPGLTGLALDGLATLGFTPGVHRYETAKTAGVSVVTVVASSDDSDATVEVLAVRSDDSPLVIDTDDADPDTAGHQVALSEAGETLALVLVTSADAKRQDIYVVLVRQPAAQQPAAPGTPVTKNTLAAGLLRGLANSGAPGAVLRDTEGPTLTALSLGGITLIPQFAAATTSYTATVDADTDQVTVTATPTGTASVMLTPADADPNTAGWQVALPAADPGGAPAQTAIAVIVASADGMAVNTYLITVTREAPPSNNTPLDTLEGDNDLPADHTTTGVVALGGSVTGTVDSASDIDWWAIPADLHGHLLFDLEGVDTGRGSLEDPWIYGIFSARNSNPWSSRGSGDAGVGRNSQVSREFHRNSRYSFFVAVRGHGRGTNTGTYTLTVTDITNIEDDYAADTTTTGTVQVGDSVRGLVQGPSDRDWFGVVLTAARTYRFDLGGETNGGGTLFDPHLFGIHDAGGTLIDGTADADSGTYYNSRVLFTPTSTGAHYVAAGFVAKGSTIYPGTYTLAVTDVTDIPDSHSADTETSGTIELDTAATGEIDYKGDSDWFKVTLEAGTPYQVDVKGADTGDGTLPDPHLQGIRDADGAKLSGTADYNRGAGRNARTVYRPPASGTYYVAVAGFQSVGQTTAGRHREQLGTYTVTVADVTDGVAADTTTSATVTVGASMTGTVDYRGDVDWVAVSLTADEVYRIELDGISLPDPKIHGVRNADGDRLAGTTDDDSGRGDDSRVDFTPASDGTYYVVAGGSPNATGIYTAPTGTYRLTVSEITDGVPDDYPADTSTTGVVEIGGSLRGEFETSDDEDWFAVTLQAGTSYEFNVNGKYAGDTIYGLGTVLDPDIGGLYRQDGTLIPGTARSSNWWNFGERLEFSPDVSGPYYLATKTGSAGELEGTYTVSVNEQQ